MTTIEVGAMLASALLVKGTVIAAGVMIAARFAAKSASGASLVLCLGPAALGLVLLLGPLVPARGSGLVSIPHDAVQQFSIGPLSVSPVGFFVGLWAVGAVLLLLRFLHDLRGAFTLTNRAAGRTTNRTNGQTDKRVAELLARAANALHITRVPEVRETTELATAALIGFRRPVLLIPVTACDWSDEELFGILCHELDHMRRGDWLMMTIERIFVALFWVNPLVHLLVHRASTARERAADDAAMLAGAGASAYAVRLISVARDLRRSPRLAVSVAFADGGRVDQRVHALFESRDRRPVSTTAALRMVFAAVPFVVALAVVEPWTCLPGGSPTSEGCE